MQEAKLKELILSLEALCQSLQDRELWSMLTTASKVKKELETELESLKTE